MNDHAPCQTGEASHESPGTPVVGKGQLTGEQHLISVVAGFPAGFSLVLLVVMVCIGWSTWPSLFTATIGGIVGILALVFAFGRWNARVNTP